MRTGTGIKIWYDSSSESFFFFSVFRLFFRFVNEIFVCLFVENSSHLRWLFSEIPLPPRKISNWLPQFHWNVHSDCYATLTILNFNLLIKAWVWFVWMRRKKVSFERFEYTRSRRELKNTVAGFFKKLEFELIMNQLKSVNFPKVNKLFYLHQILKILTGIYLSTLLLLYLAYRVLGSWNSCKH